MKHSKDGKITVLSVYVDDMILTGNSEEEIKAAKEYLSREFEIKDLGYLRYFLGMEVARTHKGISINQRKYTLDLLRETDLTNCRPMDTPMESTARKNYKREGVPVDT